MDLIGVKSLEEFRERVQSPRGEGQPDEWILGGGWDETLWPSRLFPTAGTWMRFQTAIPCFWIASTDTLPSRILGRCNWRDYAASRDPEGGEIDRDTNGHPPGILRDTAQQAVLVVIPQLTHDRRRRGIELRWQTSPQHGVTSAQDYSPMGKFPDLSGARKGRQADGAHFRMAAF